MKELINTFIENYGILPVILISFLFLPLVTLFDILVWNRIFYKPGKSVVIQEKDLWKNYAWRSFLEILCFDMGMFVMYLLI